MHFQNLEVISPCRVEPFAFFHFISTEHGFCPVSQWKCNFFLLWGMQFCFLSLRVSFSIGLVYPAMSKQIKRISLAWNCLLRLFECASSVWRMGHCCERLCSSNLKIFLNSEVIFFYFVSNCYHAKCTSKHSFSLQVGLPIDGWWICKYEGKMRLHFTFIETIWINWFPSSTFLYFVLVSCFVNISFLDQVIDLFFAHMLIDTLFHSRGFIVLWNVMNLVLKLCKLERLIDRKEPGCYFRNISQETESKHPMCKVVLSENPPYLFRDERKYELFSFFAHFVMSKWWN